MTNNFTEKWNEVRHALRHHWNGLKNETIPSNLSHEDRLRLNFLIEELRTLYGKFEAEQILLEYDDESN